MTLETVTTSAGTTIYIRDLQPDDVPHLIDIFEHMSPESRFRRFNQTVEHVSPARILAEATTITHLDAEIQQGLIAFAKPDTADDSLIPIGVGRYVRFEPGIAEIAMSVRDDFHNQGVGKALLQRLWPLAIAGGIKKLVSTVLNNNDAAFALLRHVPFPHQRELQDGMSMIMIDLDGEEIT